LLRHSKSPCKDEQLTKFFKSRKSIYNIIDMARIKIHDLIMPHPSWEEPKVVNK